MAEAFATDSFWDSNLALMSYRLTAVVPFLYFCTFWIFGWFSWSPNSWQSAESLIAAVLSSFWLFRWCLNLPVSANFCKFGWWPRLSPKTSLCSSFVSPPSSPNSSRPSRYCCFEATVTDETDGSGLGCLCKFYYFPTRCSPPNENEFDIFVLLYINSF